MARFAAARRRVSDRLRLADAALHHDRSLREVSSPHDARAVDRGLRGSLASEFVEVR